MMCLESDGAGTAGSGSQDCMPGAEDGGVETLSGRMSPVPTILERKSPEIHKDNLDKDHVPNIRRANVAAAGILSVGNVLNYLDRYTVAGVLLDIQQHFGVKDSGAGLLQTG